MTTRLLPHPLFCEELSHDHRNRVRLESDTFTHHADNATRAAWREAVARIAEKARSTLPDCTGRVDRAVAIVLNHGVELLEDGKAKVASQSNGTVVYHLVNGACS